MAPYKRGDSPFWWLCLERPGQRPIRTATKIPIDGGTPDQTRANALLARRAYAAQMGDLARARYQFVTDRATTTFAKHRAWYAQHISPTKRNLSREVSMLGQLGRYFDEAALHQIAARDILEWRTSRAREVAPATVNRELALLKHLLGSAIPEYLERNPAAGVKQLRVPEQDVRLLEPDEETRLLAIASPLEQAIVICALDTLQRLSNVAGLKRAQDHGTYITVLNPKVKGYKVPVSQRLRLALDALPKGGELYFPSLHPDPRNKTIRLFQDLLVRAKLPTGRKTGGLSFHCLRHTGASRMLARGVDIKTVQLLGGWQNLDVLQKYLHPTDAQKVAAVEAVSRERGVNASGVLAGSRVPSRRRAERRSARKTGRKVRHVH